MATQSHWRKISSRVIRETIDRVGTSGQIALRKALFEAYPFGQRKYHPYKIWCDELRIQLGLKHKRDAIELLNENQIRLF